MKLLCISPGYWPAFQHGGPIFSIHGLNKALVRKGVKVTVYATNAGLEGKVPINEEVDVDGVRVTYFGFTKFFEFIGATGWQFSWVMAKTLRGNLKTFDLVHIYAVWNYPVAATAYYCREYKKPYIICPSGCLYPYTANKKLWKKWLYYNLIAKRDIKGATVIHYTTEDEAEKCHSYLGLRNRAVVISNGIDLSEFNDLSSKENLRERHPILKDKKVVLFLSRINWKKGLDILVKAFGMLAKERDDIHLLIVGGDEKGYCEKVKGWIKDSGMRFVDYGLRSKDYGADVKVTFTGMLIGKEKLEAYAGSDIFVLPSYSENFGMAAVEAMACGCPVVVSNKVGIYKEIERNKAGIIIDTTAKSLYWGIKLLLENFDLKKEIANNGRKLVRGYYDIEKVADRMIAVYEELAGGLH